MSVKNKFSEGFKPINKMNDEQKKYAELIIAMTTDLILGNIEFSHYSQTLDIINKKVQQLNK